MPLWMWATAAVWFVALSCAAGYKWWKRNAVLVNGNTGWYMDDTGREDSRGQMIKGQPPHQQPWLAPDNTVTTRPYWAPDWE